MSLRCVKRVSNRCELAVAVNKANLIFVEWEKRHKNYAAIRSLITISNN